VPEPVFSDSLIVEMGDHKPIGDGSDATRAVFRVVDKYDVPGLYARATAAACAPAARPGIAGVIPAASAWTNERQGKLGVVSVIFRLHSGVALSSDHARGGRDAEAWLEVRPQMS
jgi:hypothetical protein